jgi:hypothetical protein
MTVTLRLDLSETVLRSIRAADGRGGRATRKEARAFAEVAVRVAVDRLPPPKVRRPKVVDVDRRAGLVASGAETPAELRDVNARIARAFRRPEPGR